jgi:hypothetical protein
MFCRSTVISVLVAKGVQKCVLASLQEAICIWFCTMILLIHTLYKKVSDIPIPRRDVINPTLTGRE